MRHPSGAPAAGIWLPGGVQVGSGVSQVENSLCDQLGGQSGPRSQSYGFRADDDCDEFYQLVNVLQNTRTGGFKIQRQESPPSKSNEESASASVISSSCFKRGAVSWILFCKLNVRAWARLRMRSYGHGRTSVRSPIFISCNVGSRDAPKTYASICGWLGTTSRSQFLCIVACLI